MRRQRRPTARQSAQAHGQGPRIVCLRRHSAREYPLTRRCTRAPPPNIPGARRGRPPGLPCHKCPPSSVCFWGSRNRQRLADPHIALWRVCAQRSLRKILFSCTPAGTAGARLPARLRRRPSEPRTQAAAADQLDADKSRYLRSRHAAMAKSPASLTPLPICRTLTSLALR